MKFKEIIIILQRLYREYIKKHFKRILLSVFLCIILAFTTKGLSLYFARINIIKVGVRIGGELQKKITSYILRADIKTLENRHSGKYISNIFYDAGAVTHLVSTGVLNLVKDSFSLIALVSLMFYQNWKLASFAIVMMPLAIVFAKSLGKRMGKAQGEASVKSGVLTVFLTEIFKAAKMIRIYQKEKIENANAEKAIDDAVQKNIKISSILIRATPVMETLTGFMIAGFIFYAGKLISSGELEINNFFSFLAAMMLAYQPIRSLATINMTIFQGSTAAKRIFDVIDDPIETLNDPSLPDLEIKKCNIRFEDVGFTYLNTNERAVKKINFNLNGGTMTAFVGHSGAGKSTVINLLPRFYEPQAGRIYIDEQNIHKINLESLRKNISLVSQDVILFDDSIRANISYANAEASEKEIAEACDFAAATEFIKKLPEGFETKIGENGVRISGGQKQRISIARAILKKSPIILLDEATSSLDADSEQIVQNAISNLVKNKTTLVIAHRLSTIHNADQIFVLKNGSIIDSGNHDSLIKSSEEYKSLYQKQLK